MNTAMNPCPCGWLNDPQWGSDGGDVGIHSNQSTSSRKIQLERFSKIESSNIVANIEMRVGEIRQFCKLQDEGQSLMRAV